MKKTTKYNIQGMSCAACATKIEKVVSSIEGVDSCSVNLLANSMDVQSDLDSEMIIKAVCNAGYKAKIATDSIFSVDTDSLSERKGFIGQLFNSEKKILITRLVFSLIFLIALMIIPNHFAKMILCLCVMVINCKFFIEFVLEQNFIYFCKMYCHYCFYGEFLYTVQYNQILC